MALTKEDLQAIGELMDSKLEAALKPLEAKQDVFETKLDTFETKLDTFETKLDTFEAKLDTFEAKLGTFEARLGAVEDKQDTLSKDITHLNHNIEPMLKTILEGIQGLQGRGRQIDQIEDKVDDHDHRIWALEQARQH